MKNVMKGLIIFFSVLMFVLIGFLTYALVTGSDQLPLTGGNSSGWPKGKLINTQEVSMKDIDAIDINNNSKDIIFKQSDSDQMIIKEYRSKSQDTTFVSVSQNAGKLQVKSNEKTRTSFVIRSNYRYYEVYLPQSYEGSMAIKTSSGDIYAEMDFILKDYTVNSSSGYLNLQNISAEDINITTSSGDVNADYLVGATQISCQSGYVYLDEVLGDAKITTSSGDVNAGRIHGTVEIKTSSGYVNVKEGTDAKIETTSGDVTISNISGRLDIECSSGYIRADHISGGGKFKTSSGDVRVEFDKLTEDLQIKTSSGYVYCDIPEKTNFQFQADTSSGDIDTDFDESLSFNKKGNQANGQVGNAADYDITVNTGSGNVNFSFR